MAAVTSGSDAALLVSLTAGDHGRRGHRRHRRVVRQQRERELRAVQLRQRAEHRGGEATGRHPGRH